MKMHVIEVNADELPEEIREMLSEETESEESAVDMTIKACRSMELAMVRVCCVIHCQAGRMREVSEKLHERGLVEWIMDRMRELPPSSSEEKIAKVFSDFMLHMRDETEIILGVRDE